MVCVLHVHMRVRLNWQDRLANLRMHQRWLRGYWHRNLLSGLGL